MFQFPNTTSGILEKLTSASGTLIPNLTLKQQAKPNTTYLMTLTKPFSIALPFFLAIASASYVAAQSNQPPAGPPRGDPSFKALIKSKDADKSGTLTFNEVSSGRGALRPALFEAIDANGDGSINQAEAAQADLIDKHQGPAKKIAFEGKDWVSTYALNAEVVEFKGKTALHIVGREQCYVYLPIDDFQDGVIEVDIAGSIFSGIAFRGREDGKRAEKLYFRPQNANTERHQNTVQYAVIGREDGHWRYLRTNHPGKYETGVDIAKDEWFRAKFVIEGQSLKVFVNDSSEPTLIVDPLLDGRTKGSIGVWGWDSYFANFKYTPAK
ncbi:MAG: hypothetical protein AAGB46_05225 [Verrucomicrobiota bacterium]